MGNEDEVWPKPFFVDEEEFRPPTHPLQDHPDWPLVLDPEIEKMEYQDPYAEEKKPLSWDDPRIDKTRPDMTRINPEVMKQVDPPTLRSLRIQKEILENTFVDTDPRNQWLYEEPKGPFINTISRREWGAIGVKPRQPLDIPVKNVRFTYTKSPGDDFPMCLHYLQNMQKEHMESGLSDIAYNYIIGRDGALYEGRGWYEEADRPPEYDYLKRDCLDIAYFGDFTDKDPPWVMVSSAMDVIRHAVLIRVLDPNFNVIPYRPVTSQIRSQ